MLDHGVARAREALRRPARARSTQPPAARRRLAPDGHRAHGHGPGDLGGRRRGRCHDVPNLYIVDGSMFVTSAGVNPTSTIQALALYIADGMIRRRA